MSVLVTVQLPAQPAIGGVVLVPLGGNGFISPHSLYQVAITSEGDGGGGYNRIFMGFDTRYVQLVGNIDLVIAGPAAAENADITISASTAMQIGFNQAVAYLPAGSLGGTNRVSWAPSPLLVASDDTDPTTAPSIRAAIDNTDAVDMTMYATVFNFDRSVRERVPFETICRCLVRASSVV